MPVVVSLAVSFVQPMFLSQYLIICLPPLVVLAARGLTKLPSPVLIAAVAVAEFSLAVADAFGAAEVR